MNLGFREDNSPGLDRFTTRDTYNGALDDLNLGMSPWTSNRYAYAGGNPITGIELDGHCPMDSEGGCDAHAEYEGYVPPVPATDSEQSDVPADTDTQSTGERVSRWLGAKPLNQRITEEVIVKPIQSAWQACSHLVTVANRQCQSQVSLLGASILPGVGVGVRVAARPLASLTAKAAAEEAAHRAAVASASKLAAAKTGTAGADDVLNGVRLRAQLTGQEIAGGHAFGKHILDLGEFPGIRTRAQFATHIEDVVMNGEMRPLGGGRSAFWLDGTVVIRNPRAPDGGTAFQPTDGYDYFLNKLH